MEPKSKYQYTYFIHTFLINQNRYNKYISKMLRDERFKLKIFNKEKDLELYTYFLPNIRNFLFKTFEYNKARMDKIDKLPFETRSAILSELPCIMFEYNLENGLQGKTVDKNSIFFKIQKVGVICFNTGICFLYLRTNLEDSESFSDLLNFNYKFRDINQEYTEFNAYDNIKLQADYFSDIKAIKEFITEITGPNFDAMKINLDVERFYTYSYECIDQFSWNNDKEFEHVKDDFFKFANISPSNQNIGNNENESIKVIPRNKFSKLGVSKLGVNLFSSNIYEVNYTTLPQEFENQYFYTYILALYLKVYLKKVDYDFKIGKNIEKTRKDFIEFTKNIWVQEITSEDFGSILYHEIRDVLELEESYAKVKGKYDLLYREMKIEKNEKISIFIAVTLVVTLLFNIINWILSL